MMLVCKLCEKPGPEVYTMDRSMAGIDAGDVFHYECAKQVSIPDEKLIFVTAHTRRSFLVP